MSSATLCIDAGTSLVKAVVFDANGEELASASRPTQVLSPRPGWAEQDMMGVLDAVLATARQASMASPIPIGRIAVTAQGDGLWPLDANLRPAGPAILWNDARSVDAIEKWRADGVLDEAFRRTGSFGNLGLPHALLRWDADTGAGLFADARWAATCGSWIFAALTGALGLHVSEASAPWLEVGAEHYSDDLLDLYGLRARREILPPLLDDGSSVRPLLPEVSELVGVPARIPVVMAPYDVVSTGIGSGATLEGDAFCILGTTLCTGVIRSTAETTGEPTGLTLLVAPGGPYVRALPTLAGTGVLDWMSMILGVSGAPGLSELAAEASADYGGTVVWPYLSPAGERAPFLDPATRGVVAGLSFATTRADLAGATLDGLAHVVKECLDVAGVESSQLVLAGGGSASATWRQIIANVTGVPTSRPVGEQAGARGALVVAAALTGDDTDVASAAARLVHLTDTSEPHPEGRGRAHARHQTFLESRAALRPVWNEWSSGRVAPGGIE